VAAVVPVIRGLWWIPSLGCSAREAVLTGVRRPLVGAPLVAGLCGSSDVHQIVEHEECSHG
ncbi:hypothetical protein ACWGCW_33080, partial [Streptomyces sp. NPDC054933]